MKKSLCVLLALGFGGYLLADTKLDTKVISATGFDDSVANISQNMLILTGDEIRSRGYKDLKEALNSLPNVSVATTGMGTSVDMRGWGEKANSRVKVMVDGVGINPVDTSHLATPINTINIEDVEQIEVIPGGGSVIYGDKSSGGVINIITKSSLSKEYANAYFKVGSFSHKSFGGGLGHKLNDKLYANVNFNIINEKGYQWADINESVNANFGLRYTPDDSQSLALNASIFESDTRGSSALDKKQLDENRRQASSKDLTKDVSRTNKKDISLKYQNDINEHFMVQITPFYSDFNGNDGGFSNKRKGVHLRGKASFGVSTTYLGYELYHDKGERHDNMLGNHIAKLKSNSVYMLENLSFDPFSVDFGARYQKINYDMDRYSPELKMGAMTIPDAKLNTSSKQDDFAVNVALGFDIDDSNKVYAKVERGFALPEAFEITDKYKKPGDTKAQYHINDIKKETYMNYELGYKGLIADQYASFTLFYTDTKDEIFRDMNGFPPTWKFYNINKTERYGAELALSQSLFDDSLELYENIGYISAKAKEDSGTTTNGAKKGEKIPQVSPFNASLGFSWAMINELKLRGDYNYYSKTKWKFEKEFTATNKSLNDKDAYGVLNLGITYLPTKNLTLSFDAKNVLGEEYNVSCAKNGVCNPAPKQSFYAEFRYKY